MSKSYEIIDPSLYNMVNETSNKASLINENNDLRNLNTIILLSAIVIVGFGVLYYYNRDTEDSHLQEK
ncbi:hypothetical protein GCM10010832_25560 [Psychroflexus planctonicus]|uniref:Uncharacterized protein n=1 Tax=Psychroflexus planctonicus TaxID=1526575 RepID=A0ABQ1SKY5_9FLAO|nr:hypothetical protein GCM10010832_25560 [Psychroflexus planctonicus]